MIFIGIDPGVSSGAIAAYGAEAAAVDFPKEEVDVYSRLETLFDRYSFDVRVVLERILMTPKTREFAGMQKLLGSYHSTRGMLIALKVPFETLTPRQWQKEIGLPGADKSALYTRARELFPAAKVTKRNADAFLLAELCRRRTGAPR